MVLVKIYNYQATQSYEVINCGWLSQFKGVKPGKLITFGKDIEAIIGAAVSANSITNDIQQVLRSM